MLFTPDRAATTVQAGDDDGEGDGAVVVQEVVGLMEFEGAADTICGMVGFGL